MTRLMNFIGHFYRVKRVIEECASSQQVSYTGKGVLLQHIPVIAGKFFFHVIAKAFKLTKHL